MPISDLFAAGNKPNILLLITDQQRSVDEWPESYRSTLAGKLPALQQLMATGLSFDQAYTASCMCSPSRATFLTSQYPIVTGCTITGGSTLPLPTSFPNIASVLTAAGYTCYWMGKWHLLGNNEYGAKDDALMQWGFQIFTPATGMSIAWDPPDAGITLSASLLGGGTQGPAQTNRNDQRYVADAQAFLADPPAGPWCLVVSLVNPHDVHLGWKASDGTFYDQSLYQGFGVPLPKDVDESPNIMPRGQNYYTWAKCAQSGATQQDFANFYVYLMEYVDGQIGTILSSMSEALTQETLIIRFADHGEMGLAHGLVEKFVNAYGQCVHVPLIFSNPVANPTAQRTEALASTVDLAPTLAGLLQQSQFTSFVGTDLSPVLNDPSQSVQDYVHFTYDDMAGGAGPSVIRGIRSQRWAYSVYVDSVTSPSSGYSDADWEMYDLATDPAETKNIAGTGLAEQTTLDQALQQQMLAKATQPEWYPQHWPPQKTSASRGGPPASSGKAGIRPVEQLPGIDPALARDLIYVGVPDSAALLARTATPGGRADLANLVQVDPAVLEGWIAAAST